MNTILVIDLGTSSMRGILFDQSGRPLFKKQKSYKPEYSGIEVEQNPETWLTALIEIVKSTVSYSSGKQLSIDAVSTTCQRSSVIPIDSDGNVLHKAIMWQDKRNRNICEEFSHYDEMIFNRAGTRVNPVFSGTKITWIKRNLPELYRSTYKFLLISDYIHYHMTGAFASDYTYGSRTALMNLETCKWDAELLKIFEVDEEKLCPLVEQGTLIGCTSKKFFDLTGLPIGTPVVSAGGDQQCAALGLGVIDEGSLEITTGTGSFIIATSNKIRLDSKMRVTCNVSAEKGKYILESSVLTSSTIYNWFCENFYREEPDQQKMLALADKEASNSPAGANGVIMFPHFMGRGSNDWNNLAKGMFFNITLSTTRGDFTRSIFEGIAAEISESIDILENLVGKIDHVQISGGLTKCELFNHIQANMYGKKLNKSSDGEATSLGALISASVAIKWFKTCQEAYDHLVKTNSVQTYSFDDHLVDLYDGLKQRQKILYEVLNKNNIFQLFAPKLS